MLINCDYVDRSRKWPNISIKVLLAVLTIGVLLWLENQAAQHSATQGPAPSVLIVSLEFRHNTFSGNGIYAISQAEGLAAQGIHVLVVCARPVVEDIAEISPFIDVIKEGLSEIALPVPMSKWGSLGMESAWEDFADAMSSVNLPQFGFVPDAILGVDWHGVGASVALVNTHNEAALGGVPIIYMSYRVFSRSGGSSAAETDFYATMERRGAQRAALTVALSQSDAAAMQSLGAGVTSVLCVREHWASVLECLPPHSVQNL
eukprot:m.430370 g.430370  ORF g.430370 m.430370 type:complete len:261 (-) comp21394_c0_seq9:1294-2076(-)